MKTSPTLPKIIFFALCVAISSLSYSQRLIDSAFGSCAQVGAPASHAIDNNPSTYFTHTQCGLSLFVNLTRTINSAWVRVRADRAGIMVNTNYQGHQTTRAVEEFFIHCPGGISQIVLTAPNANQHRIFEVEVVEINPLYQSIIMHSSWPPGVITEAIRTIDGDEATFFSYVELDMELRLTETIQAARVVLTVDRPNMEVWFSRNGSLMRYYTTIRAPRDEFFIIAPSGFSSLWFRTGTAFFQINEIRIERLDICLVSVDFEYNAAGGMIRRSILFPAAIKSYALNPVVESQPAKLNREDGYLSSEVLPSSRVQIYPNPTRGLLHVELDGYQMDNLQPVVLTLYSMTGVKVMEVVSEGLTHTLDLGNQPTGVYILTVRVGGDKSQWRVVRE